MHALYIILGLFYFVCFYYNHCLSAVGFLAFAIIVLDYDDDADECALVVTENVCSGFPIRKLKMVITLKLFHRFL